jgi:NADPH-dependent 2,4-dienoyl-CoA reductase/sulfur reductase-like enzyme
VSLADGSRIDYDTLLLATGAQARMLDAPVDGPPVFVIRTLEDTRRLRPLLVEGARVAIIGAGVIGLEAAASAAMLKCRVSVVELADRVMARIVPPEISHFIADRHRREGVDLHLSAGSVAITPTGVRTATVDIDADLVIVGIGVVPNVGLAEAAGLDCRDGILVDACARTSDPDIFAVGDVARYPDPFGTGDRRCENWKHAQAHALTAVKAILGDPHPYATASSMWSDQYDLKLQTVGRLSGSEISRGEFGGNKFMILYVDAAGVLVGALGINSAKDIRFATTLIEQRRQIDPDLLADPKQDLRKLAA